MMADCSKLAVWNTKTNVLQTSDVGSGVTKGAGGSCPRGAAGVGRKTASPKYFMTNNH